MQSYKDVQMIIIGGEDHKTAHGGDMINHFVNLKNYAERYGAYRDKNGELHIVDITCTHLGCELKWNSAEKSWDCPCHGSRFTFEGDVIEGRLLPD